jgi:hypothetical protein
MHFPAPSHWFGRLPVYVHPCGLLDMGRWSGIRGQTVIDCANEGYKTGGFLTSVFHLQGFTSWYHDDVSPTELSVVVWSVDSADCGGVHRSGSAVGLTRLRRMDTYLLKTSLY